MRNMRKRKSGAVFPLQIDKLKKAIESNMLNKHDLSFTVYGQKDKKVAVFFIPYLVDQEKIEQQLLDTLLDMQMEWTEQSILDEIPLGGGKTNSDLQTIIDGMSEGEVHLYIDQANAVVTYPMAKSEKRGLERSETEAIVIGPQLAFTESLTSNLNVLSWRLNTTDLAIEKIMVGKRNPKETRILYLKSVANQTDIDTMRQRLSEIELDMIEDIHMLKQYILDNSLSVFPQFVATELVDRAMYVIKEGKIVVLIEDSPYALIAPSTFFSFFESTEDRYFHWNLSTFIIMLRFLAAFITIINTPFYVAAVTFHYELVPSRLLLSIGESRATVPFPPILEVIILEMLIELLREAGARLPTKVGQTIGIVGGVVVGTAAVQAGIASNILIILVTLSALASFVTPSYVMGNTLRFIRFPLIILSGLYGLIGIMFGLSLLTIHLLRLKSLGRPYLAPVYPFRWADFNKVFFRLPEQKQGNRFLSNQPKDQKLYDKKAASTKKDIDS